MFVNNPLSVIIPTKNRHNQLIKTILAHKFWPKEARAKMQLVIADNSDEPLDEKLLSKVYDIFPNASYANISSYLTVSENFRRGLEMSNGEWITFIGDDDFFMPSILTAINDYHEKDVDCIVYNPNKYYWDSCVFVNKDVNGAPGALVLSKPWEDDLIISKNELIKSLRNGGLTIERMPRLYHGLVRRKVAKNLCLTATGEMALGSPDISLATILSCSNVKVQGTSKSLTVYGASDGSGGGMTTAKTHVTPIDKATFLSANFRTDWDKKIPKYWSEYTVFPASMIFVSQQYNLRLPCRLNYAATYVACFLNEFEYRKFIYRAIFNLGARNTVLSLLSTPYALARKLVGKLYRKFKKNNKVKELHFLEPSELFKYDG